MEVFKVPVKVPVNSLSILSLVQAVVNNRKDAERAMEELQSLHHHVLQSDRPRALNPKGVLLEHNSLFWGKKNEPKKCGAHWKGAGCPLPREELYGRLLSRYLSDPGNVFIISSDFCHWGSRFSYVLYDQSQVPVPL